MMEFYLQSMMVGKGGCSKQSFQTCMEADGDLQYENSLMLGIIIREKSLNSRRPPIMTKPLRSPSTDFPKDTPLSHNTLEENLIGTSSPQNSESSPKTETNKWNFHQQRLYISFWLGQFIKHPYQSFSLLNPVQRAKHAKNLSKYIERKGLQLGIQARKTWKQCKNKFTTQKRKYLKQKFKGRDSSKKGLIDYIAQQASKLKSPPEYIKKQLQRVREMMASKSPYMQTKKKLYQLEDSLENQTKNEKIRKMLISRGITDLQGPRKK